MTTAAASLINPGADRPIVVNLAAVSRELGKDRTQIRRWMKRFGLARNED